MANLTKQELLTKIDELTKQNQQKDKQIQDLQLSEERYRLLFDQAPFSIQVMNPEGQIIRANQVWRNLTKVDPEVLNASGYTVLKDEVLKAQGISDRIERGFSGEITKIQPIPYNFSVHNPTTNEEVNRTLWLKALIYPIKNQKNEVVEVVLLHEDVTDKKVAEDILRTSEARLRQANEELVRLSQVRSEFITLVSHELRTPLTVIYEGINLLMDGVDGPVNEDQKETLILAKENVDRLSRLVYNVINFTKIQAGKYELELQENDLKEICHEVYDFMTLAAGKKGIHFNVDVPKRKIIAKFDADKIRQVLINLLDNAIKFTPEHGRVSLELKGDQDTVFLYVRDSGKGISGETKQRVEDLLLHGESRVSRVQEGHGLGLAIAVKLVMLHKGSLKLLETSPKGSVFVVTLPKTHEPGFIQKAFDSKNMNVVNQPDSYSQGNRI